MPVTPFSPDDIFRPNFGAQSSKYFEHFFVLECFRLNDYFRKSYRFSFIRTKDDLEVDLVVERPGEKLLLIEIKSALHVDPMEISRLKSIQNELSAELWFASQEKLPRRVERAEVLPWEEVLIRLFT